MLVKKRLFAVRLVWSALSTTMALGCVASCDSAVAQSILRGEEILPTLSPADPAATDPATLVPTGEAGAFRGEGYLLGVGDSVRVEVFNIPDYGGEFRVLSGGTLNLPVAGSIVVEGLSLQQAATLVEKSLEPFVRRPRVTLSVLEVRPIQIAIAGEVNRPGAYQISVDGTDEPSEGVPTLTGAIELAGGITQLADIRKVKVQRRLSPISTISAVNEPFQGVTSGERFRSQSIEINLWTLLKEGDLGEDMRLQDGDRITIPKAAALDAGEIAELATASFSPDQISVNVVGEVEAPGSILVPPNTPLNQAILTAGGFNNRARTGTVNLVRLNPDGTASEREIEIDFAQGISEQENPSLRPNDTIIVRRSGLARTGDTVRAIFSPIGDTLRILNIFGL